jgi:hypothetical protein
MDKFIFLFMENLENVTYILENGYISLYNKIERLATMSTK